MSFLHSSDPGIHRIVPASSTIEKIAGGFTFTEGPVWTPDGDLLFSDIPENTIFRWKPSGEVSTFRKPSGYDGKDAPAGAFVGSNGLTLDHRGCLTIAEHGNHRVTRLEPDGSLTVLCSHFNGKRLNSPNDLVWHSSGKLYFTDPPYGFMKQDDDPAKELDFNGVFYWRNGELTLLHRNMTRPNGVAFTPDEKTLYVGNSDPKARLWNRFDVNADGTLGEPELFANLTQEPYAGNPDGMKLDVEGNLYCTGPGGVWVFTPEAKILGRIEFPEIPANCHWGDADGQMLYVTARTGLYRIKLNLAGIRP